MGSSRRFFSAPILLVLGLLAVGHPTADPLRAQPGNAKGKDKSDVVVTKDMLSYKGTVVPIRCPVAAVEKVLGKAGRTKAGLGHTKLIWDKMGLVATNDGGTVDAITVQFKPSSDDSEAMEGYAGSVTLNGVTITKDTRADELKKSFPKLKVSETIPSNMSLPAAAPGQLEIILETSPAGLSKVTIYRTFKPKNP